MAIGPQLPPHLKRKAEDDDEAAQIPEPQHKTQSRRSSSSDTESNIKRRRVKGPAPPPAPLEERPPHPPGPEPVEDESSSEDDDFGPSLPTAQGTSHEINESEDFGSSAADQPPEDKTAKRDEWMMVPPKQDDLAARMDPTKIRARGFNTGKGAKGANQTRNGPDAAWMETPEQKRKRLANEVMGISETDKAPEAQPVDARKRAEDEEKAKKIKDYNEKHRSRSLYDQHQGSEKKQKDDDPSARGFDYEKDMGGGMKIGHAQKKEMMKKASDFGSRFSSGSYL